MKRIIKIIFGFMCLLIGIAIYLYPNYREWKLQKTLQSFSGTSHEIRTENQKDIGTEITAENRQDSTSESSEQETESNPEEADETGPFSSYEKSIRLFEEMENYNLDLVTEGQVILDAWSFKQTPVDLSGLTNETRAIGSIEIPEINLTLPLYIGASEENMSNGAVVLAGTSMPIGGNTTNCVIAAHRGWSGSPYFRDIDQMKIGSEVIITNPWEVLKYQVTGTEIIHETENNILNIQPGKDMVTLFSCYPYGAVGTSYRQVIFCERTRDMPVSEKESEGTAIKTMTDQILQEKGIVIEEDLTQTLSGNEDLIRIGLPLVLFGIILLMLLIRHILEN